LDYAARNLANGSLAFASAAPTATTGSTWGPVTFDAGIPILSTGLATFLDANNTTWNFTITNNSAVNGVGAVAQDLWVNTTSLIKNSVALNKSLVEVDVAITATVVNAGGVMTTILINSIIAGGEPVPAATAPASLDYSAITVASHTLALEDVSIPVEDYTDSRTYKVASSSSTYSLWDVAVIQPNNYGLRLDGRGNPVYHGNIVLNGHDLSQLKRVLTSTTCIHWLTTHIHQQMVLTLIASVFTQNNINHLDLLTCQE